MKLSTPFPPTFNLTDYCLKEISTKFAGKSALIYVEKIGKEQVWTFKQAWDEIAYLAEAFCQLKLSPQSRVLMRMKSSPDYVFVFFATILAGLVPIPTYEGLTSNECQFILEDSEASLIIQEENVCQVANSKNVKVLLLDELKALKNSPRLSFPLTQANDPAFFLYTSGVTSKPKGVVHAQRTVWGRRPIRVFWLVNSEKDILLHTDTLNWSYTLGIQFMDTWPSGSTALLYGGPKSPEIWADLIDHYHVTLFASTPSLYEAVLNHTAEKRKLPSLRHCLCAGESLKESTIAAWEEKFGVPLYEGLGSTEISIFISTGPGVPHKKGSIGKPHPSRKIAVLSQKNKETPVPPNETALLAIHRSEPGLMLGYWKRPKEEEEVFHGEWYFSMDLVHYDEQGYIWYHERVAEILNIDSDTVSPKEVEEVLAKYPSIKEVACWTVRGDSNQIVLGAFVVLKEGESMEETSFLQFARNHLADYKIPKKIFVLDKLPRSPRGKVIRRKLPGVV